MTLGQAKKTAYALIDEYSSDESTFTSDEDLTAKINLISNVCYYELSGIKPIKRMVLLDRTVIGTTDYIRSYNMPADIKKLEQIVAYEDGKSINPKYEIRYGVATIAGEITTYSDKIYINDLDLGDYYIKYQAYPTDITETSKDTFELELDKDAQMLLPFAIASDILKSDVSSNYTTFQKRYEDQLSKLDIRKSTGIISFDDPIISEFKEF